MATVESAFKPTEPSSTSPPNDVQPNPFRDNTTQITTPITKAKKSSRAGVPNYSEADISRRLELAEEVEPVGANHWSIVATRFGLWAGENERHHRDLDSLRGKFDKLANAKKKTGDPSYPSSVRRAKQIARAIQNKCAAMTLDDSSGGEAEEPGDGSEEGNHDAGREEDVIGVPKKKRKTAATGQASYSKQKTEELLLVHVGKIAPHIGMLSDSISGTFSIPSTQKEELASMIREEVREILRPTDLLLLKMNKILEAIDFPSEK